ncbi:MarR family winged helix-turn-helix transcriptional regulator [Enterovirga aerilata]|uniref:Winged helix-turn-helix transcriptional regulator n=1 Tax=Enterovirga aerilata TaxID=2730920 RepID=A0A849I667_9HYPH|nr:MarR family winged helix-turn-helix transcriptional regulator [Enterovirga sp. DB1703]NNM71590.1 winged helix-turn-helix transcriptional regulator [Enterovirga sp. DB1703]
MSSALRPDPDREPALRLSEFLPYRLNVLAETVSEGLARSYGTRFGISVPEWRVLATLGEFRSMTAKAVGAHSRMGKVKVSRAVAALEGRGLVRRRRNEADLREAFLVLTPEGERLYRKIVPLALAHVERLTAGLSAADRAHLDRLIDLVMRRSRELGGALPENGNG